jgi:hypothetical protein
LILFLIYFFVITVVPLITWKKLTDHILGTETFGCLDARMRQRH